MAVVSKGLLVAAPRSGSGKTTLTLGLLRAFKRRGIAVGPAKCGPDYIDPGFHKIASGRASLNLDGWAMRGELLDALSHAVSESREIVIGEALMGLFDGASMAGSSANGSSASIAARLGWPVLLVLDVSGQSETAAAMVKGFASYDPNVRIAGVVLNRVASERHHRLCAQAIEGLGIPVVGSLPRNSEHVLPERHLGLVQAEEMANLESTLERIADFVEANVDMDKLLELADGKEQVSPGTVKAVSPPGQRIALARDIAFSFFYQHLETAWREAGAEILPFSPLADEAPDPSADVCWLPGGYPELHAGTLASNRQFLDGLRSFAATRPVHGECGGFMVLGERLEDKDGTSHQMSGLLGLETSFAKRKMNLGYRDVTLREDTALGVKGAGFRGHEFHYATIVRAEDAPVFDAKDARGESLGAMGGQRGNVTGSFFHLIDRKDD